MSKNTKTKKPMAYAIKRLADIDNYQHQDRDDTSPSTAKAERVATPLAHALMKGLLERFGHQIRNEHDLKVLFVEAIMKPENHEVYNAAMNAAFHQLHDEVRAEMEADERHADGLQGHIPQAFILGTA